MPPPPQLGQAFEHSILIVSYEALHDHGDALFASASVGVDLLVVDEAHRLRNSDGEHASAVAHVPAAARLLLTATPMPNAPGELYSLLDLARPGRLSSPFDFDKYLAKPIAAGRQADASASQVARLSRAWKYAMSACGART